MQTPDGFPVNAAGQFIPADWIKFIFNPSFPYRLVHMVLAADLTTDFVVGAVGALHVQRDSSRQNARIMLSMAMWMATVVASLQILAGDMHGLNTLQYQPAKVMAIEGHFKSHPDGAPLILFGVPDQNAQAMRHAIEIPKLSSRIPKHDLNAPLAGLDTVAIDKLPSVAIIFWSFRIMVATGFRNARDGLVEPAVKMARTSLCTKSISPVRLGYGAIRNYRGFDAGTFYILRLMNKPRVSHEADIPGNEPVRASGIIAFAVFAYVLLDGFDQVVGGGSQASAA